jgi:hypothetical protein
MTVPLLVFSFKYSAACPESEYGSSYETGHTIETVVIDCTVTET